MRIDCRFSQDSVIRNVDSTINITRSINGMVISSWVLRDTPLQQPRRTLVFRSGNFVFSRLLKTTWAVPYDGFEVLDDEGENPESELQQREQLESFFPGRWPCIFDIKPTSWLQPVAVRFILPGLTLAVDATIAARVLPCLDAMGWYKSIAML